ncbi:MAG: class II fructose-bisphosphate aldolase [Candidatus Gracilibacteria bacterium]|jgi:fructose-bisphosphate aldolase class II
MSQIPAIAEFSKKNNPNVRELEGGYVLSNLKTLLTKARAEGYGVVAINQRSKYVVEATLEAAWQAKSPVICEVAESEAKYCNMAPARLSDLVHEGIRKMYKKYGYFVPVCLHMDHVQKDLTTIDRAVEAGFSSVEADLSKLPLVENAAKCAEIVTKLHPLGVSVEVEEGEIGAASALSDPNIDANIESYYTKAEDAKKLCELTMPDAIAIFVGNGHGQYLKEPKIGFDRIKEVAELVNPMGVNVVLHGGSGLAIEVFNKAIDSGASKMNYATTISDILFKALPESFIAEMDAKAAELKTDRRKVLYLFEEKMDVLDPAVLKKAVDDMSGHIIMMMKKGFKSAGRAS